MNLDKYVTLTIDKLSRVWHRSGSMTIVTGASAPYYNSMRDNLIASVMKYEPEAKIVVWDMGLMESQYIEIQGIVRGGIKIPI